MTTSIIMTLIWVIYLQLVLVQYRRANRPFLLIHHAHENDPGALCLFVNMSKEPVHLQCVKAFFHTETGTTERFVTDYDRITPEDQNVLSRLRQGPIQPGGYIVLGSFASILSEKKPSNEADQATQAGDPLADVQSFELCIAVTHGPSKYLIGARRRFYVENDADKTIIRPHSIHTEQLTKYRKRKIVMKWAESRLEPKHEGESEQETSDQSVRGN